jgi:hypothetical protein
VQGWASALRALGHGTRVGRVCGCWAGEGAARLRAGKGRRGNARWAAGAAGGLQGGGAVRAEKVGRARRLPGEGAIVGFFPLFLSNFLFSVYFFSFYFKFGFSFEFKIYHAS